MSSSPITLDDIAAGQQTLTRSVQDIYTGQQTISKDVQSLKDGQQSLKGDVQGLTQKYDGLAKNVQGLTKNYESLNGGQQSLTAKLDNLTELVTAGFDTINDRFDRLETRVDRLEAQYKRLETQYDRLELRISSLGTIQQETTDRLGKVTGNHQALYADVVELYKMAAETKRRYSQQLIQDRALASRLQRVEASIRKLAAHSGLSYKKTSPTGLTCW
jgi:chromosome segregation ATPase